MTEAAPEREQNERGIFFEIGGEKFAVADYVPVWQIMKLAKAYKTGERDPAGLMGAMYDFVLLLVHPDVRDEVDEFLSTLDITRGELDTAIGETLAGLAGRGKARPDLISSSSDGSPETPPISRVVSLSGDSAEAPDVVEVDGVTYSKSLA